MSRTLWLMREANLQEGTSSVMNRMQVERTMKEEKRLAKQRQEKQGSNRYHKFLEKLSNILCLVLKLKEVQRSSQVLANLLSQWLGVNAEIQIGLENGRKEALR